MTEESLTRNGKATMHDLHIIKWYLKIKITKRI